MPGGEEQLLQYQMLAEVVETLRLQPLRMTGTPGLLAWVDPPLPAHSDEASHQFQSKPARHSDGSQPGWAVRSEGVSIPFSSLRFRQAWSA